MGPVVGLLACTLTVSSIAVPADPGVAEGPRPASQRFTAPAPSTQPEPMKGRELLIGGAVVSGLGLSLTIAGLIMLHPFQQLEGDAIYVASIYGGSFMGVGLLGLAVGVPLLAVGVHRHRAWKRWERENRVALTPQLGRGARGSWSLGLELRF